MDQRGYMVEAEASVLLHGTPVDVLKALSPAEDLWTAPQESAEGERHAVFARKTTDTGMLEVAIEWRDAPSESEILIVRAYINSEPYDRIARVAAPLAALAGAGAGIVVTRGLVVVVSAALALIVTRWIVASMLPRRRASAEARHRMGGLLKRGVELKVLDVMDASIDLELR
jgi:hypothetical protein